MIGVWVAAGAAILGLVGVIVNVICTVKGNRKTAREIVNLQNQHADALERSRQKHELNLAALEKRLEAHQQAFTLLWKFFAPNSPEALSSHARECEIWWVENCLYLNEEASRAFRAVCSGFVRSVSYNSEGEMLLSGSTWSLFVDAFENIQKVPGLPSLNSEEPT